MSPHIIATVTIADDENRQENYSPASSSSQEMHSPKPKGRVLYCRKCEGHGEKVILKNHSPQCPYILCNCKSCEKLNFKRLKSFNKRNKDKIELAAALNAKRHATNESSSPSIEAEEDEAFSRRSSFSSSKTSSPGMDTTGANTPALASPSASGAAGLEGRSMSLGSMTVMSYDIWKAKCASEKKRLEEERAKKTDPFTRSPSPTIVRKRAHTFVAQPLQNRTEDIPVVAPKKMSVDEKGKGKYILLPTIPAMRIFVNDAEEEKPVAPAPAQLAPAQAQAPMIPMSIPSMEIPSTSSFQVPMPPRLAPMSSPFKPVLTTPSPAPALPLPAPAPPATPLLSNMSMEQIISSLTLTNTVIQQQQNQMNLMHSLPQAPAQPPVDLLNINMLRMQQQQLALTAMLQAAGINLPAAPGAPAPAPVAPIAPTSVPFASMAPIMMPKPNPFLQGPMYSNPV